jgi:hypothetical protein
MKYTIVGVYTTTWLRYVGHFEGESPMDAALALAKLYPDESISVVAVFEGWLVDLLDGDYPFDTDDADEFLIE